MLVPEASVHIKVGALVKIEDSDMFGDPLSGQIGIVTEIYEETLPHKLVIAIAQKGSGTIDEIEVWEDEVKVVS